MISLQKAQWIFLKPKGAWKARCPERCLQRGLLAYYSVDVKTVSGMLGHFVFWARTWVNRYSRPLTRTISHQIAKKSPEILRFQDFVGKSTARGYNAPCFDGMVHSFATFVLMRWDTADGKDRIALLSQEPSCSSLYHFFNHLQLLFSIDHVRNASWEGSETMSKKRTRALALGNATTQCVK